jgi:hypothetical protein
MCGQLVGFCPPCTYQKKHVLLSMVWHRPPGPGCLTALHQTAGWKTSVSSASWTCSATNCVSELAHTGTHEPEVVSNHSWLQDKCQSYALTPQWHLELGASGGGGAIRPHKHNGAAMQLPPRARQCTSGREAASLLITCAPAPL